MDNFFIDLGLSLLAVTYGVGMWWVGIQMGIDIMKRNPETREEEPEAATLLVHQANDMV